MTISALCFDATGTLIEATESVGEVYHRVALEHSVDLPAWRLEDAFHRILRHAPPRGVQGKNVDARIQNEVIWWFERIRETFQATDSTARFHDFQKFADALFQTYRQPDAWRPREGIPELLDRLQQQNLPLAVVSNFDHRLPEILEASELAAFFSFIATPSETGLTKPHPDLFHALAARFEIEVTALGYVGDDSQQTLRAINEQGVRVFDIREFKDTKSLAKQIATAANLPINPSQP